MPASGRLLDRGEPRIASALKRIGCACDRGSPRPIPRVARSPVARMLCAMRGSSQPLGVPCVWLGSRVFCTAQVLFAI